MQKYLSTLSDNSSLAYAFSTFRADTPHLYLDIDRTKLQTYDISVADIFSTLQDNLGATYINNITLSGQINRVILQADFNYRKSMQNIKNLLR